MSDPPSRRRPDHGVRERVPGGAPMEGLIAHAHFPPRGGSIGIPDLDYRITLPSQVVQACSASSAIVRPPIATMPSRKWDSASQVRAQLPSRVPTRPFAAGQAFHGFAGQGLGLAFDCGWRWHGTPDHDHRAHIAPIGST
jgi:hypothetical protein